MEILSKTSTPWRPAVTRGRRPALCVVAAQSPFRARWFLLGSRVPSADMPSAGHLDPPYTHFQILPGEEGERQSGPPLGSPVSLGLRGGYRSLRCRVYTREPEAEA